MRHRAAILDDYQNIALTMADWSRVDKDIAIDVFQTPLARPELIAALRDHTIVCAMRERTAFPRDVLEKLPNLKLLVTTGMRNAALDVAAARSLGIMVCGTQGSGLSTSELAAGLMLELARKIGVESAVMKRGGPWQTTVGVELRNRTLGILGLGRLGAHVAAIGKALNMNVIAWSPNLTEEKCRDAGVGYASKEDLFRTADFVSVHLVLGDRSRGLIGDAEFALMKPTAYLINTARGPIVQEDALLRALRTRRIAGAGLDVFDVEPLPADHPLRMLDNVVLTPHLGYATVETYGAFYEQTVEAIRAWLDGKPIRVLGE